MSDLKQWARSTLRGIENCIFPSFSADFSRLDEAGIRWDVEHSIRHGFVSTVCAVEAGLSAREAKQFVDIVTVAASGRISVSVNLIADTLEDTQELARHAQQAGAATALLGYPFHFWPSSAGEVIEASRRICRAAPDLGFFVYPSHKFNFGRLDPMGFPLEVIDALLEEPNVIGVKMGLLEPGFIFEVFRRYGSDVVIEFPWERWWPLLIDSKQLQFAGAGAYELFQTPEQPRLVEYFGALQRGEVDAAMQIYWSLVPVRECFEQQFMPTQALGTYHWPQQKFYQWLTGGNGGFTRQPVMKLLKAEMDQAAAAVRAIGVEVPEDYSGFFRGRAATKADRHA
ncbi:MAG: dihydrodipicolinate synthase family protein [Gammaproteobacteria bacterium]|nr:dihydrodipicolinate synthase family protein [Gammaproteobacteria bacterium]